MTPVKRDVFASDLVAHDSLRGSHDAPRFAPGTAMRVITPVADLRLDPSKPGLDRQILFGHRVCLLDPETGLSQDETTGYVGHVKPTALDRWQPPTHRVATRSSLLFAAPDIRCPDPLPLPCGAHVSLTSAMGRFAETAEGAFAVAAHLEPLTRIEPDLAATAVRLLGVPYLWGGNSAFGIDCSGLVQLCAQAAGLPCPGDSDQQRAQLGKPLETGAPMLRGDLLFWPGHVAIVAGPDTLIHANAHHMAVAAEPLTRARARIDAQPEGPLTAHKRL